MRQNFLAQFVQLLKCLLFYVQSSIVLEENRALSVDQCWLRALQFLVHFIDLRNILLRYNSFIRIQKAIVDQMGSRPQNSDRDLFWCKPRSPGKGHGNPLQYLPGEFHRQRSMGSYSPWGHKESDTREAT